MELRKEENVILDIFNVADEQQSFQHSCDDFEVLYSKVRSVLNNDDLFFRFEELLNDEIAFHKETSFSLGFKKGFALAHEVLSK